MHEPQTDTFETIDELPLFGEAEGESGRFARAPVGRPAPRAPVRRPPYPGRLSVRPRPRGRWSLARPVAVGSEPASEPAGGEYARWVQHTLNAVLGLRLPVDGAIGPETRSAIRAFQRRGGLPEDGIVGPPTEAALIRAAGRGRPQPERPTEGEVRATGEMQEGGVSRRSREYVRWVQRSLNRLLGLRLAEDGMIGPETRSAIRSFQQQRGISVDGVPGPHTERALVAAGATPPLPRGTASPVGPAAALTSAGGAPRDTATLRRNIARLANQEWQRWGRGTFKESDVRMRTVLAGYWTSGAGSLPRVAGWWSKVPWSAAFISWVMRNAGAGNAFRYAPGHAVYVKAAKDNRLANNSNPFKAYRVTEVQPRVGDLICRSRAGSGATYDNIRPGMATHCDIVTEAQPGRLVTVGGNVQHSVSAKSVATDAAGYISTPGYFAVIRVD